MTDTPDPIVVDTLLENKVPFRTLRKQFKSRADALQAYADYHAALHAFPPGDQCCVCGQAAQFCVQFAFQAYGDSSFHISRAPPPAALIQFWAFEPFCRSCWRKSFVGRIAGNVVHFLALIVGVLVIIMGVLGWGGAATAFGYGESGEGMAFLVMGVFSTALLVGVIAGARYVDRLRLPRVLRDIRRPFQFTNACREQSPGKFPFGPTANG